MRILYLHQYFTTPAMNGGTRSYEMGRRLVQAGHEVHMVTTDRSGHGRGWRREQVAGIDVHWCGVPYRNEMGWTARLLAFLRYGWAASRRAVRLEYDVVLATSTPLTVAFPALVARRRRRVPLVFEVRDLWPEMPIEVGALRNPLARRLALALERQVYRRSARVVALSPGIAEGVARAGCPADRIRLVPNGCDIELFDVPPAMGEAFVADRPWLQAGPLVVYAGTLGRINGVTALADLAAAMAQLDPRVRFLVVGEGAEQEVVRQRAASHGVLDRSFFMERPVPKADVPALLSAATLCTSLFLPLPAMEKNSANKFFDALAAGRPVAINYGGWQAEMVEAHGLGVVVPANDPAAAAEVLLAFLSDDARLERARRAARALARSRFSRDSLALRLEEALAESVASEP